MRMTTKIAFDNMKYHRSKNILTGIAIFLATLLLLVIPTVGYDMVSAQFATINECYPTWYALYRNIDEDTVKQLSLHHDISRYGLRSDAGVWNAGGKSGMLLYLDEEGLAMYRMDLLEGRLPQTPDEIVVSEGILNLLGTPGAKIGDRLCLSFQIERDGGLDYEQEQEFVICGFLEEFEEQESFNALISEEFLKQEISGEQIKYRFLLQMGELETNNMDTMESAIYGIAAQFGIPESDVGVNTEYLSANYVDPTYVPVIIGIMLIIVIAGIVTIYSIYYVSMAQRVQEFGRMKAIGATKRQIRQILFKEGMLVAFIAIPAGLVLGSAMVKIILIKIVTMLGDQGKQLEITKRIIAQNEIALYQWWIYPAVILIVLFTVYLSLVKPVRKLSRISVVDAMRYQDSDVKKNDRKGYESLNLVKLACNSFFRNKKRSVATILSMSITGIFIMVVATVLSCANPAESANSSLVGQYVITQNVEEGNKEHPEREWIQIQQNNPLNEELAQQLADLPGVERVDAFSEIDISGGIFEEGGCGEDICGIPEEYAKEIEEGIIAGDASYEDLKTGEYVIVDQSLLYWFPDIKVGDELSVEVHDGEETYGKTFTVLAIGDYRFGLTNYSYLIMAKEAADRLCSNNVNRFYSVIADQSYDPDLAQEITDLISSSDILSMGTWQGEYEMWSTAIAMTRSGAYAFLAVLSIICVMNLINTMMNSIHVRRKELGMLQAIGMSNRQLHMVLQMEGGFYILGTLILSIGIGSAAGYPVFLYAKRGGWFEINKYHYPLEAAVVVTIVLIAVQVIMTYLLGKALRRESLIDRIRFSE